MPEGWTMPEPKFGNLADFEIMGEIGDGGSDSGESWVPSDFEDKDEETAAVPTTSTAPRANLGEVRSPPMPLSEDGAMPEPDWGYFNDSKIMDESDSEDNSLGASTLGSLDGYPEFIPDSKDWDAEAAASTAPRAERGLRRLKSDGALLSSMRRTAVSSSDLHRIFKSSPAEIYRLALGTRGRDWLHSFRDLDPRLQILQFFNDLSLGGVEMFESNGCFAGSPLLMPQILRGFIRCGIFSVWRPTSNDAIRMMMTGEGTGKGLDIKGKSAKRGKYSGFVPFLQIDRNDHKKRVGSMRADKRVRVFYSNRSSRDTAASVLNILGVSMTGKAATAEMEINEEERRKAEMIQLATLGPSVRSRCMKMYRVGNIGGALAISQAYLMDDPTIYKIDDYSLTQGVYGLDIPEKLFWEGYTVPNDISRDSDTLTGRPSMPEFQTMNIDTLRKGSDMGHVYSDKGASADADPRPVLWHGDCGQPGEDAPEHCNPMSPIGLLMAYEENGKVTPVVSDFDCFLLGTRNVKYEQPLGKREHLILSWCISEIEGILETPINGDSWTKRWLEVKKKHVGDSLHQGMPKFGYADPRSYSIMKGAVYKLKSNGTGAVRHGPECFNYGFPQELDDEYLVVSDTFPGVPWRYTDASGLIDILREKIGQGFTFPLNPKWILCDPGWKSVYDQLMASTKPNVQDSMDVWYPKNIRERIHEISNKYPQGFIDTSGDPDHSSGVEADLAQLELERYVIRQGSQRKLRAALSKQNVVSEFVRILEEVQERNKEKINNATEEEERNTDKINEAAEEKEPRRIRHQKRKTGVKEKVKNFLKRGSSAIFERLHSNISVEGEDSDNLAQTSSNKEEHKTPNQSSSQKSMPKIQPSSQKFRAFKFTRQNTQ